MVQSKNTKQKHSPIGKSRYIQELMQKYSNTTYTKTNDEEAKNLLNKELACCTCTPQRSVRCEI